MMPTTFDEILASLTPNQRDAVLHTEGPLLVLAGPGSGKTRVITCRIANLIHQGVRPYQILAITFTNKAAARDEAARRCHAARQRRLDQHLPQPRRPPACGNTPIGSSIDRNFTIYDQGDRVRLVKAALEAAGIDNMRFTPETIQARHQQGEESTAAARQVTPPQASDYFSQIVAQVYAVYEKKMRDAQRRRFRRSAPLARPGPQKRRRTAGRARRPFSLCPDRRISGHQQGPVRHRPRLDDGHPNLCVVGDPDQSIYRWRGSDIRNILDFERDFPDARVITLGENFRSTKAILRVADHLIAHNKKRKPKELYTANTEGSKSASCCSKPASTKRRRSCKRIRDAVDGGQPALSRFRHPAARSTRCRAAWKPRLSASVCRFRSCAASRSSSARRIATSSPIFGCCSIRATIYRLRRAVNEPPRGIGKTSLEHLQNYAEPREMSLLAAGGAGGQDPGDQGQGRDQA